MAKMIPSVPFDTGSRAEIEVFNIFAKENILSDEWTVFHSYRDNGDFGPREWDFILLSKEYNILVIEVKGGIITHKDRIWYYQDGQQMNYNPYQQSSTGAAKIYAQLKSIVPDKEIRCNSLVCFPDVDSIISNCNIDSLKTITIFRSDLNENLENKFKQALPSFIKKFGHISRLKDEEYILIRDYLKKDIMSIVDANETLVKIQDRIISLKDKQKEAKNLLINNNVVLVNGIAGSGKTILAIERCEYGITNHENILFLCNKGKLFYSLLRRFKDTPNIQVSNFEDFKEKLFYHKNGWDTIIIDEAQELQIKEIINLRELSLRNFYIFYDDNQKTLNYDEDTYYKFNDIMNRSISNNIDGIKYTLYKNYRNPKIINDYCRRLIDDKDSTDELNICAPTPKVIFLKEFDLSKLENDLHNYIIEIKNKYLSSTILILTNAKRKDSHFIHQHDIDFCERMEFVKIDSEFGEEIYEGYKEYEKCEYCPLYYSYTISDCKGTDASHVILIDEDNSLSLMPYEIEIVEDALSRNMLYTAISRTTYSLVIIKKYTDNKIMEEVRSNLGFECYSCNTLEEAVGQLVN